MRGLSNFHVFDWGGEMVGEGGGMYVGCLAGFFSRGSKRVMRASPADNLRAIEFLVFLFPSLFHIRSFIWQSV